MEIVTADVHNSCRLQTTPKPKANSDLAKASRLVTCF